jgi:hypothetical protein
VTIALPAAYLRGARVRAQAEAYERFYGTSSPTERQVDESHEYGLEPDYVELNAAWLRREMVARVALVSGARGGHALAAFDYNGRDYDECREWAEFFSDEYGAGTGDLARMSLACMSQGPDALAAFLEDHGHELPAGVAETLRRIVALSITSPETYAADVATLLAAFTTPAGETSTTREHGPPSSRRVHCRQRRHLVAASVSDDPAPSRRSTLNVYGDSCRRFSLTLGGYVAPLP